MVIDSNAVIYAADTNGKIYDYLQKRRSEICVSDVSRVEVLGFHALTPNDKLFFTHFFAQIRLIPISEPIVMKAIELRSIKKMSLGDAFIAATALVLDEPLFTNNFDDFRYFKKLKLIDGRKI